ncbi:MAG: gliding motility-associated C-terminal domain-containing protein [Saprospiraceae bacterium]|nr:gliding motility-associated C-terminal domain-containing protein [Saprospiraceae bacterium]
MTGKSFILALLFCFATLARLSAQCDCVTTGNCPVPINDNGIYNGYLDVTVNGPNDLAQSPLQQVCITLTHTWIGDLSVSLTSPSGLEYLIMADAGNNYGECGTHQANAEVCIVLGTNNPLTNNSEYICNSAPCSVGTCCLNGNWTVPCGGVVSPITGAIQAPNCNLNDFNVPGQPANGTWTLSVLDVCNQDAGNLENFSLTFAGGQACYACEADGGALNSTSIISCAGDTSLNLHLPPNYPSGPLFGADSQLYAYTYLVVQGNIIIAQQAGPDLTNLPMGNYKIYGLSYLASHAGQLASLIGMNVNNAINLVNSSTAPFCADFSDNAVTVTIGPPIDDTNLVETICQGDFYNIGAQQFNTTGNYTVVLNSVNGCDSTIYLDLTVVQPDTVDITRNVCTGGCVTVGSQSYCAPASPPYETYVHLQNWQGCDSTVHLTFVVHSPVATITPASPPALSCTVSSVNLSAATSGPGTLTYAWSGPGGFNSTSANISVSTAGTYTVTVSDNAVTPACTSTASATIVNNTVQPDLALSGAAPSICQGQTFNLGSLSIQDANNTGASITFHSGTPASAGNQLSNLVVSPSATTTYYAKATIGSCTDELPIVVTVNPVPTATFSVTSPICLSASTTVTYTGSAGTGATYNWNFGGGTATPGTGAGPHTVTYTTSGTKTITLTVTENGCPSTLATQTVVVDAPLAQPVINCSSTTSSVTFTWSAVPNSTSFTVNSSVPGTQISPTSYQVTGLTPGQQVSLTVTANGPTACGNSSATQTCTAQSCPPNLAVAINPVAKICRDANTMPFNLQSTVTGGTGNGTFNYSGPGITNAALGTFNPSLASLGANTINVTYSENGCPATNSTVIEVFQTPTASISATTPVCRVGSGSTVTFTAPSAGMNFTWDFGGGFGAPGTGAGPQNVTWGTSGTKTVSVIVDDGSGCPSAPASATVVVEEPLPPLTLTCTSTTNSVVVSWPVVTGAAGYTVNAGTGHTATMLTPTSYEVTGLAPGEQVMFTVTAIGVNSCGNQVATTTCTAQDCPPLTITIDPVADICLDATSLPVLLQAHVTGAMQTGTFDFVGTGVSNGYFNPQITGAGTHAVTAIYTDGPCSYTKDMVVNVFDTPTGDFTAPAALCQGSPATVSLVGAAQPGLIYTWDFDGGVAMPGTGAGPHTVNWSTPGQKFITLTVENAQGCMSPIYAKMVNVTPPVPAPQPTCNNATTTSIEFTWPSVPGATGYTLTTSTGQTGTQTGPTTWLFTGLQPQEQVCATVTAEAGSTCPGATAQLCCNALPCPSITVDAAPLADICLGTSAPIQLQATVTGDNGTGVGTWSGPGVINGNTGTFNPSSAGFGLHTLTYTFVQDACTFTDAITVGVYQQPTSDFSLTSAICLSEAATVQFNGVFSPTAVYTWDFGGGVATPGTGVGPHQVTWGTSGNKTVSLSVVDGSCSSAVFTQNIQVDDQLAQPTITCSATTDGVVFTWNTVPNATGYTAIGTGGLQTSDTTYVFSGLDPEQPVSIQLTVNGTTSCPLPVDTLECSSLPCPALSVTVQPVSPMCLTQGLGTIQLVADIDGTGIGNGTRTWSGVGVVDAAQGIFDPTVAGAGLHEVTCTYQLANCTYQGKGVVSIVAPPTADAGPDRLLTCWESDRIAKLGGPLTTSSNNITYLWSAATGAFPGVATTRTTEVDQEGLFTLTVTNSLLGCSDTDDVLVVSTQSMPKPTVDIVPIHCGFNGKDANMTVNSVTGGSEPYLYSLNDEPFVAENVFGYLEAGDYKLTVLDAEGCTGSIDFTVKEAGVVDVDLTANIVGQSVVKYGESITLTAISSLTESELDSIVWTGGTYLSCTDCLDPVATPLEQTNFVVTLHKGQCLATDSLTVYVDIDEAGVYVPTAFSPNGDGNNDRFMIYSGPTVERIKSFLVFDRWGEKVYEYMDFDPKDPARGWNGQLDGQPMNPAVYVWFAEVQFIDGSVRVLEGDVTLMR